jgi:signal transduction histidine kinase
LEVARAVVGTLEVDLVLERVLEVARELTGARYAALGVLDDSRRELSRFLTVGVDAEVRSRIGDLPRGRGVLGELIRSPVPLRLEDVGRHPRSYGFPSGHPPMRSFLGVPVLVEGEAFGNLYLTEKAGGPFDESDEEALVTLAGWAGVAIENARRFEAVRERRDELEQAVAGLAAMTDIARALAGETDLKVILELVVRRARALVSARNMVILLAEADDLVVAAAAGELSDDLVGARIHAVDSVAGQVLRSGEIERLSGELNRRRFDQHGLGSLGMTAAAGLFVPLRFRNEPLGVLVAMDRLSDGPEFTGSDARLLEAFAVSAGTAVATARSLAAERTQQRLNAAEEERRRWARELHDETLQSLAILRLTLSSAREQDELDAYQQAAGAALEQIDAGIQTLRALITELRPVALDELGPRAALEALAVRSSRLGLDVHLQVALDYEDGRSPARHVPELEVAVYRIVQEAIQNAAKHSRCSSVDVRVSEDAALVEIVVRDDGNGFDPRQETSGYGLLGMRERAELLDGTVEITSVPGAGTTLHARLPVRRC